MPAPISLTPLSAEHHADALQEVYATTPSYWHMYNLPGPPVDQAKRDLQEAADTPGRTMLGIVQRLKPTDPRAGGQLIGLLDFRVGWPQPQIAYLGMIMVAEPFQRQGQGRRAWRMWLQWLRRATDCQIVRVGVEQFNPGALKFCQRLGFQLTGESNRIRAGDRFVRLLYMEYDIGQEPGAQ
jgi:RimJ/RimL family protein N-acetyltransferase